jgi:anti-sigma factor RsiW
MHLTDVQLNEYLDNETTERVYIEEHLAFCEECAARLTALQTLFSEIESLPELELTHSITARFVPTGGAPLQLPRWLTLTATLQAALALVAIVLAAPLIIDLLPAIETPSLTNILIQVQTRWVTLLNTINNYQVPTLSRLPIPQLPSLMLAFTLAGVSLLWLVGNGLLLRKQMK